MKSATIPNLRGLLSESQIGGLPYVPLSYNGRTMKKLDHPYVRVCISWRVIVTCFLLAISTALWAWVIHALVYYAIAA